LSALVRRLEATNGRVPVRGLEGGTFQSNSPVGVGSSVHDMHASNIDLNAQARTEMSSNPFMWMFNMPNQQDFWKNFIDKRVQEALL
jgi:hypothetical protein